MVTRLYTDDELTALRIMPKRIINPGARWSDKPSGMPVNKQRSFKVVGAGEEQPRFEIYQRQNLLDSDDYSCGIAYVPLGGSRLTLARYNGPAHIHGAILYKTHIHRAAEESINAGRKPEREAEETDRYHSLEGALACLIFDYNVSGIHVDPDQPRLL